MSYVICHISYISYNNISYIIYHISDIISSYIINGILCLHDVITTWKYVKCFNKYVCMHININMYLKICLDSIWSNKMGTPLLTLHSDLKLWNCHWYVYHLPSKQVEEWWSVQTCPPGKSLVFPGNSTSHLGHCSYRIQFQPWYHHPQWRHPMAGNHSRLHHLIHLSKHGAEKAPKASEAALG